MFTCDLPRAIFGYPYIDILWMLAKTIENSLATINSPVSSQDLIDYLLLGLGREYDTLIGIITHFPDNLSLEKLRTKHLLHDQRLQRLKDLDSVFFSSTFCCSECIIEFFLCISRVSWQRPIFLIRGWGHRGRGRGSFGGRNQQHFSSSNSPRNSFHSSLRQVWVVLTSPSSGVFGAHPSSTSCQICGYPGHSALQCTNRFNHVFVANDLPKSFATMSVGETNNATWYFDSVASAHMTPSEGYASNSNGHRCLDPKSDRNYVNRHVLFHESVFLYTTLSCPLKVSSSSFSPDSLVVTSPLFTPQPYVPTTPSNHPSSSSPPSAPCSTSLTLAPPTDPSSGSRSNDISASLSTMLPITNSFAFASASTTTTH
ncbi:hypothetical protein H5410_047659 [Solanum commersonii]|uniref:Retroviral polymerase SH3-like domain-containing protein n=1 Tax=Solanum commersonii TaxID=4109 RepID=A0A9J5XFR8_SOLCO|nr:hypothetical protein H5410_047659 [Solanum commersonii]